jgi:3-methylcrotonyl-CoA carboxylase beta subunit
VMGSCTAGGAYVPAMSDETIIVKGTGTIFIGGPPLVKAATGQEVERRGAGRRRRPCAAVGRRRPLRDFGRARARARSGDRAQPEHAGQGPALGTDSARGARRRPGRALRPDPDRLPPAGRPARADRPASSTARASTSSRRSTARRSSAASPGSRATRSGSCEQRRPLRRIGRPRARTSSSSPASGAVPLVFLQNITGFMVGKEYEAGGIARDGAKLVTAVACAEVPKFTVVVGGSFGAGNYGMCGRAYSPRQLWMWPNARISVMGGEQAATVLTMVGDADPDEIRAKYEAEGNPYYSTARLWDDGIIDPLDTRACSRSASRPR